MKAAVDWFVCLLACCAVTCRTTNILPLHRVMT